MQEKIKMVGAPPTNNNDAPANGDAMTEFSRLGASLVCIGPSVVVILVHRFALLTSLLDRVPQALLNRSLTAYRVCSLGA